jgi:F-type H+-transporting ATPase subunit b
MPQFDASTFASQLFWLFVCFGFVCFIYVRYVIPRFNQTIEKRLHKVRYDLEQAQHLNEQIDALLTKHKMQIDEASKKAEDLISKTLEDLEAKKKLQLLGIQEDLSGHLAAMEQSVAQQSALMKQDLEMIADECVQKVLLKLGCVTSQAEGETHVVH